MVEFDKKVTIVEGTSPQRSNSNPKKSATSFARRRAKGPDKLSMVTRARDPNRGNSQQRRGSLVSRAARYVTSSGVQPRTTMGSQLIAHRIRQTHRLTLRERAFLILEEPTSSLVARLVSLVVTLATLVATTAATLETCRDGELGEVWKQGGDDLFAAIRTASGIFFLTEAIVRVVCYIPLHRAILDPFIWLDCLTPLPFVISLALGTRALPIAEAWGSLRLLKLCRYYEGAGLLAKALRLSVEQLFVPLFMLSTMVVCCSSVLFNIEHDPSVSQCADQWKAAGIPATFLFNNPGGVTWDCGGCGDQAPQTSFTQSVDDLPTLKCATCAGYPAGHPECQAVPFMQTYTSIPHTMWFLIVTVSTVGFGDVYPSTTLGQCFISIVILGGILFLAMPLAVVGNNFQQVWNDRCLYKLQALTRQMLSENDMSPNDCMIAFKQFDNDGDGLIDEKEFNHFVTGVLSLELKKPDLVKLWGMLDLNRSGNVNFTEFTEMLFPNHAFSEPIEPTEVSFKGPLDAEDNQSVLKAAEADRNVLGTEVEKKLAHQHAEAAPSCDLSAGAAAPASLSLTAELSEQLRHMIAAEIERCMIEHTSQLAASVAKLEASVVDMRAHTFHSRRSRKNLRTPGEEEGSNGRLGQPVNDEHKDAPSKHLARRTRRSPPTTEHPGRETSSTASGQHLDHTTHTASRCRSRGSSRSPLPEMEA